MDPNDSRQAKDTSARAESKRRWRLWGGGVSGGVVGFAIASGLGGGFWEIALAAFWVGYIGATIADVCRIDRGRLVLDRDRFLLEWMKSREYRWLIDKADPRAPFNGLLVAAMGLMTFLPALDPHDTDYDPRLLLLGLGIAALGVWLGRGGLADMARWSVGCRNDLRLERRWWHRLAKVVAVCAIPVALIWSFRTSGSVSFAASATLFATILVLNLYYRGVLYVVLGPRSSSVGDPEA